MNEKQSEGTSALGGRTHIIRKDRRRLGEIISQSTSLGPAEIEAALERCKETGLLLGEQLIEDGMLSPEDNAKCLAVQWGVPYCDLANSRVSEPAVRLLGAAYQKSKDILLLQIKDGMLYVGLVDPLGINVLDEVRLIAGHEVRPVLVSREALEAKYEELFGPELAPPPPVEEEEPDPETIDDIVENLKVELDLRTEGTDSSGEEVHEVNSGVDEMAVIRLVNSIMAQGIEVGASDIHFQGERDCLQVRYRVDGVLNDGPRVPKEMMRVVTARVKVMATLDLAFRLKPQDGRMTLHYGDRTFEARVSVLQSVKGPKAVLRLAEQSNEMIGLDRLGFEPETLRKLRNLVRRPHGMVLTTGPTGSGKSTTLYSIITEINSKGTNILTVEDPVETQLDGITQAEINERAGLSFAASLRAALRQDPDVIMVGEIRDGETAMIATQASLTGHLVLSTLHTNDAPSAVTRLVDMGIEPFLVGSSLIGVLAQRLARKVCQECAETFEPSPQELKSMSLQGASGEAPRLKRAVGCEICGDGGHKGRVGVYELLQVSDAIRLLILDRASDVTIREKAEKEGMVSLEEDVRNKLTAGLITLEEAHRIVFF